MEICKLILHILDTESNIFVPSDLEIDALSEDIQPLIEKKLKQIFKSNSKRPATFKNSTIEQIIFSYKTNEIDFVECSKRIAHIIFEKKREYNLFHNSDFIFCEVKVNDIRYLAGIDNVNIKKLTHKNDTIDNAIKNDLMFYKTCMNERLTKQDRVFIVEYSNSVLHIIENRHYGINVFEEILQCHARPSVSEAIQILNDSVEALTSKYQLDELETSTTLKSLIKEGIENEQQIETQFIADQVFLTNQVAKEEFKYDIKQEGLSEIIPTENLKPKKTDKTQKLKTDNGIEITIPIDMLKENVEFITEADGKISIRLKNIQSIERK
ncbi:MAG: nucleoid-associated protein [Traorella sp.]